MSLKDKIIPESIIPTEEAMEASRKKQRDDPCQMSYWYPKLLETEVRTPRTIMVDFPYNVWGDFLDVKETPAVDGFIDEMKKAAAEIGYPCFIRNSIMSGKHSWDKACYVTKPKDISRGVMTICQFHGMTFASFPTYFAVREFLPTEPAFYAFHGNMPVTRERRYFFNDGKVVCHHPYWIPRSIEEPKDKDGMKFTPWKEALSRLNYEFGEEIEYLTRMTDKVAKLFKGYWSVDWLHTKEGWYCIDMATGHNSFHWDGCEKRRT